MAHTTKKSRREDNKNIQHNGQKVDITYWIIKYVAGEGASHKYDEIPKGSFRDGEVAQWLEPLLLFQSS